jgi:hypothetical protein
MGVVTEFRAEFLLAPAKSMPLGNRDFTAKLCSLHDPGWTLNS